MNKFFGIGLVILLLIGITSGVLLVQRQQQLKSQAAPEVCQDNPEGAPSGYTWKADCSGRPCGSNADCPSGADNQEGWCYGFESGNKCLQLVAQASSPGDSGGNVGLATCSVGKTCGQACGSGGVGACEECDGGWCKAGQCEFCGSGGGSTATTCAQGNCGACATITPCSDKTVRTYNSCEDDKNQRLGDANFCKNGAARFRCFSSETSSCTSNAQGGYAYSCRDCGLGGTTTPTPTPTPATGGGGGTAPTLSTPSSVSGQTTESAACHITYSPVSVSISGAIPAGASLNIRSAVGECSVSSCGSSGWVSIKSYSTAKTNDTVTFTNSTAGNFCPAPGKHMFGLLDSNGNWLALSGTTFSNPTGGGGDGTLPPGDGPAEGSLCQFKIIESDTGTDVSSGPIYENGKYTFKITMTNKGKTIWNRSTYKLKASANTISNWSTQQNYPITLERDVPENQAILFNVEATPKALPAGKTFETRSIFLIMVNDKGQEFGAACEPQELKVEKKPAALVSTKCYVISEDATEIDSVTSCNDPKAKPYAAHPTNLSYPFKTPLLAGTPRTIYVKFFDSNGVSSGTPFTKKVIYNPPAALSDVDCAYDSSGLNTIYTIRGTSFGSQTTKSGVKVGNADATVTSWTATTITARMDTRLEGSNNVQVSLDDGKKLDGSCSVGTTTATLSVKNKCATAETINVDDIEVSIYETGTQPFAKQKVRSDKDGVLAGFAPKLEKNKAYTALFKRAGFLTKKVSFNTTSGTAVVEPAVLVPGDIAPKAGPDNTINSFDFSELKTQWDLVKDVTRTGDLNKDNRVNSFDWSCMKSSSNLQGDVFTGASSTTPPPSGGASGNRVVPVGGKVFFDANSDSTFNTGETLVPNVVVKALRPAPPETPGGTLTAAQAAAATGLRQTTTDANGSYSMSVTMPSATLNLVIWVDPSSTTGQGGQSAVGIGAFANDFFQNRQLVMDIPLRAASGGSAGVGTTAP